MGISFLLGDPIILGKREGYIDFPAPERRFRIAVGSVEKVGVRASRSNDADLPGI